jgi:hypothetical protein
MLMQTSGISCREKADVYPEFVIASEAKQSIAPRNGRMDCFVAEFIIGPAEGGTRWLLAMTAVAVWKRNLSTSSRRTPGERRDP